MGMDSALQLFHFYPCDVELPYLPYQPCSSLDLDPSGGHCKHPLGFCQVEGRRRGAAETLVAAGRRTAGQLLGIDGLMSSRCEAWSPRAMGKTYGLFYGIREQHIDFC